MFVKVLLSAAIVGQALTGVASAAPARPQPVNFDGVRTLDGAATPKRIGTSAGRKSQLTGVPFLLPLLGVLGLVIVVTVVASGGDDDSSPN